MATNIYRPASPQGRRLPPFFKTVKRRTERLFLFFAVAYALLGCRLGYIQVVQHGWYAKTAERWHSTEFPLLARRGAIFTRDGQQLAVTVQCASIFLNPQVVREGPKIDPQPARKSRKPKKIAPPYDSERSIQALASALSLPVESIRLKVDSPKKFVWVARRVLMPTAQKVEALNLPGVGIQSDETKRVYPANSLASNLLGFTDIDGHGREGIEQVFDRTLGGRDGEATAKVDARRKIIADTRQISRPALNGKTVTLSIDYNLQMAAEKELDKDAQLYHPAGATCTIMDVHTGEILAMATYPRFDPNNPGAANPDSRRNRPITDTYEPGSTLKTISLSSALDDGDITLGSAFHCAGQTKIGKRTIRCVIHAPFHGGHGTVHAKEIIEHSCNIGAAQVGLKMGQTKLKEYMERFGLGKKTGIELSGEVSQSLPEMNKKWANIRTANVAFGQGIAVTPLQLLTAYVAVANGGKLIKPTILRRSTPAPGVQVIKPEAAAEMRGLLKACVTDGTGKPAKIRGYEVGGKTGSAQKVTPGMGYAGHKFIASFASVIPINKPRIAILVTVDEPKGTHWGAVAAAPVVREVARQAVIDLRIPPDKYGDVVDGAVPKTWKRERI